MVAVGNIVTEFFASLSVCLVFVAVKLCWMSARQRCIEDCWMLGPTASPQLLLGSPTSRAPGIGEVLVSDGAQEQGVVGVGELRTRDYDEAPGCVVQGVVVSSRAGDEATVNGIV